jgi:hypothetical protein
MVHVSIKTPSHIVESLRDHGREFCNLHHQEFKKIQIEVGEIQGHTSLSLHILVDYIPNWKNEEERRRRKTKVPIMNVLKLHNHSSRLCWL